MKNTTSPESSSIANHVTEIENCNLHLSSLLESLCTIRYRLDGKPGVTEGCSGKGEKPIEISLLERQRDALFYQNVLLSDLEKEIDSIKLSIG